MRSRPLQALFRHAGAAILLLAALPPGTAAQVETEAKAREALAEFSQYANNPNEFVRKAAVEGLAGVDHHTVTSALLKALDDRSEAVRKAAIAGLGTQQNMLGMADLVKRVWRGRNKSERLAILESFRQSKPDSAYSVFGDLLADRDPDIKQETVRTITAYGDREGATLGSILPLVKDRDPLVRLAVVQAFAELGNPRCHPAAVEALGDPDWRIKAAAIKICRIFRQKPSIEPLIELLAKEQGRLQDDATQALQDICDRDMPGDAEEWKSWWARVGERFQVPTLAQIEERKRRERESSSGYAQPKRGDYPPYHGIKTRSRRILFVLDISHSMAEQVVLDRSNHQQIKEFDQRYGHLGTTVKIDIAREELINMVAGLKSYASFNIVTFNSSVQVFEKSLVPATGDNKNRAIKFLARLQPTALVASGSAVAAGQTNTFEAINACFGMFPGDTRSQKATRTEADTVFFLSDGNPSIGRITDPQELLTYFTVLNKRAEMVFHTIAFGASNRGLMEGIAQSSGGQSVFIGV